jgi:hypothetical protein
VDGETKEKKDETTAMCEYLCNILIPRQFCNLQETHSWGTPRQELSTKLFQFTEELK